MALAFLPSVVSLKLRQFAFYASFQKGKRQFEPRGTLHRSHTHAHTSSFYLWIANLTQINTKSREQDAANLVS